MSPLKITATIFLAQAQLGLAKPNVFHSFAVRRHMSSFTNELPIAWQQAAKDFDPKQVAFYHNEMLIKVDENDAMIGSISKGESHSIDTVRKGIYRSAFCLLVFDEQDRFLLTQRAACKDSQTITRRPAARIPYLNRLKSNRTTTQLELNEQQ
jgi:hypothetical protein